MEIVNAIGDICLSICCLLIALSVLRLKRRIDKLENTVETKEDN